MLTLTLMTTNPETDDIDEQEGVPTEPKMDDCVLAICVSDDKVQPAWCPQEGSFRSTQELDWQRCKKNRNRPKLEGTSCCCALKKQMSKPFSPNLQQMEGKRSTPILTTWIGNLVMHGVFSHWNSDFSCW